MLICLQGALSAAERQRRRRQKLKNDPVKRAEVLRKARERWHARKHMYRAYQHKYT